MTANYSIHHCRCGTQESGARGPSKLLTIVVLIDHLSGDTGCKIATRHGEGTHAEHQLSLGEFDPALVGAIWGAEPM
jgi:hypothetical protein